MRRSDKLEDMKKDYETIPLPEGLKARVEQGIAQAKQEEERTERKRISRGALWGMRIGGCAVAAMLGLTVLTNINSSAAKAMSDIPILGAIVDVVNFRTYESTDQEMHAGVKIPKVEVKDSTGKKKNDASEKMNTAVEAYTKKIIKEYKEDVKSTEGKGKEDVSTDYKVVTNNARLFSLKINTVIQLNTSGINIKIYHLDKKTGDMITLPDIFQKGANYRSVLTREIKEQMRQRMKADKEEMYFIDDKENPDMNWNGITKDSNFYIDSRGNLVFEFDKYEVAPGYMGSCSFTIPQEKIKDMIRKEYFVSK